MRCISKKLLCVSKAAGIGLLFFEAHFHFSWLTCSAGRPKIHSPRRVPWVKTAFSFQSDRALL